MSKPKKVVHLKLVDTSRINRIEANRILRNAIGAKLARVTVIGEEDDGRIYVATTHGPNAADVVWDLEFAKKWLLEGCPEQFVEE